MVGGAIFNLANLLLVAAIDMAGLAVALPVSIGIALVVGTMLSYVLQPKGNLLFIACGRGVRVDRGDSRRQGVRQPGSVDARHRERASSSAWCRAC